MSLAKEKNVLKTFGIDITYKSKGVSTTKLTDNYCKPAPTCHNPLFEGKTSLQPNPIVTNTKDCATTDSDSTTTEEIDHKVICLSKNIF